MKREDAESAKLILDKLKSHELLEDDIRRLHKSASNGNKETIDQLARICLELNSTVIRQLESALSSI